MGKNVFQCSEKEEETDFIKNNGLILESAENPICSPIVETNREESNLKNVFILLCVPEMVSMFLNGSRQGMLQTEPPRYQTKGMR